MKSYEIYFPSRKNNLYFRAQKDSSAYIQKMNDMSIIISNLDSSMRLTILREHDGKTLYEMDNITLRDLDYVQIE